MFPDLGHPDATGFPQRCEDGRKDLLSELMRAGNPHSGRAGHPRRKGTAAAALILGMLCIPAAHAGPADRTPAPAASLKGPRTVAVLDPVDLTTNTPDPVAGKLLRRSLADNPSWRVLSADSVAKQLRDLGMDPDLPCSEFQCAFDAGNALQSEFVLFGTSTDLPEVNAYTLGMAHIPTSQMVWSRVGQAPKRPGEDGHRSRRGTILQGPLKFAVSDLDPAVLDLRKRPTLGLLGVMDGGQSTPQSRVALHRALAHAYSTRSYDMLGPAELNNLVAALDLDPITGRARGSEAIAEGTGPAAAHGVGGSALDGDDSADMLALGKQMGVRYLLRSAVRTEGREYAMDLSLYDVSAGRKIRAWPSRETTDYASLLNLEDRFMTALGEEGPVPRPIPSARHPWKAFFKGTSVGAAAIGAGVLGYMAWQAHTDADQAYDAFKAARTRSEADQARSRVIAKDTETRKFGLLGGLTLALGVAVWSF
jgi:hypothetical protein